MASRYRKFDPGPIWVYMLGFAALFARFGYNYAAGDQDELIPFLSSMLNPSLFANDWFVQIQTAEIGVRTYVVWLLMPFSRLAPMPIIFFTAYLTCWVLIGSGAYRVARRLVNNPTAAATAVFVSLGVLHKWTLGSNDLVYSMFVGEMIAWGLALHGLHNWLQGRNRSAAVLLGVATWFQLLVGLLVAGILVAEGIWDRIANKASGSSRTKHFAALGLFVLSALPSIIPIAIQQLQARSSDPSLVFYVLATFRNPFHHLFLSFGAKSIIRFGVMLVLGLASLVVLSRRGIISDGVRTMRIMSLMIFACIITGIFTEVWPVLFIAKLQAFKLTVLLKFILVSLMAGAGVSLLPDAARLHRFEKFFERSRTRTVLSSIAFVTVVLLAVWKPVVLRSRITHDVHVASDLGRMEAWIEKNTDRNAIFAVPPSNSTFRSNALRAIVIDYAAFPFDDPYMIVWYDRLQDIAPIGSPTSGLGIKPILDEAYYRHTVSEWMALGARYGIDFALVDRKSADQLLEFVPVHSEGEWTLYRLPR